MLLEQQILILEWFLKDHMTLETGVMMLKIQAFRNSNRKWSCRHRKRSLAWCRSRLLRFSAFVKDRASDKRRWIEEHALRSEWIWVLRLLMRHVNSYWLTWKLFSGHFHASLDHRLTKVWVKGQVRIVGGTVILNPSFSQAQVSRTLPIFRLSHLMAHYDTCYSKFVIIMNVPLSDK